VIVKRLDLLGAVRSEMAVTRWLPIAGMADACPSLLGTVGDETGDHVWHVYEDLGPSRLDREHLDHEPVEAAIDLLAELHVRFADHPLLGEVRLYGQRLGIEFYSTNLRDAINALGELYPPVVRIDRARSKLRDRLVARLEELQREEPARRAAMEELGIPETLLHGDINAPNAMVSGRKGRFHIRFIDWEHIGVGPVTYDVSSFLFSAPSEHRGRMMQRYREAVGRHGWVLPGVTELNELFDTANYARMASRLIWPAIALLEESADWGFEELSRVESWFENHRPTLGA
jgi:thiamine kinase-like enzyme